MTTINIFYLMFVPLDTIQHDLRLSNLHLGTHADINPPSWSGLCWCRCCRSGRGRLGHPAVVPCTRKRVDLGCGRDGCSTAVS